MAWSDGLVAGTVAYDIAASVARRIRVIAGPGTGKSFAMKRRVARLLEQGANPRTILPVTFTKVAAEDLHRELVGMGVNGCEQIQGTTLHSLALRILMRQHALIATGRHPRPLNDFEMEPLESDLAADHGGVRKVRKKILAYASAWARLQPDDPGFAQTEDDAAFERDLLDWLRFHQGMIIGEVIPYLYMYLRDNPVAPELREYSEVLVDEYQDLNKAEQAVLELLSNDSGVCIVGDDDQSIYSFKHAHPDGIREWVEINEGAEDLTLVECRRCPTRVVTLANSLIAANRARPNQRVLTPRAENGAGVVEILQFSTLDAEVSGIAQRVSTMIAQGTPPGDVLILAQRRIIGDPIFEELRRLRVPVKSYYAEAELSDESAQIRFAYLKLLAEPQDRVALRFLLGVMSPNWLSASYNRLQLYCFENGLSPWDALLNVSAGVVRIPHTNNLVARFRDITAEIARLVGVMQELGLAGVVDDLFPAAEGAVQGIRELSELLFQEHPDLTLGEFVRQLNDAIAKPEIPDEITQVRVMSLHKSKGLSAPVTIIVGCVEGLLPKEPSDDLPLAERNASIEEQRRLFFVGITRVKALPEQQKVGTLILSYSRTMPLAAAMGAGIEATVRRHGYAHLMASRFIRELGPTAPRPIAS